MDVEIFECGKKKLRIQKYLDTYGRGLIPRINQTWDQAVLPPLFEFRASPKESKRAHDMLGYVMVHVNIMGSKPIKTLDKLQACSSFQ